jgi:galactonate dehydratase
MKPESHFTKRSYSDAVAKVRMMRESLGDEVDILIDFHGRPTLSETVKLAREIEKYNPFYIEEPVTPENVDALAMVRNSTSVPIATGERLFTKYGFREVLEKKACQIIQPDLCHAGGILEGKKIAAMAECYFVQVAPHNPLSPVSTAACLQLDACIPNFCIQECVVTDMEFKRKMIKNCPEIHDGYFDIPSRPGLGVELNHDVIKDSPYEEKDLPRMRREDESVAEW